MFEVSGTYNGSPYLIRHRQWDSTAPDDQGEVLTGTYDLLKLLHLHEGAYIEAPDEPAQRLDPFDGASVLCALRAFTDVDQVIGNVPLPQT